MELACVGLWQRMAFRLRERRGMPFSLHRVTGSVRFFLIIIISAGLLLGTFFVTQPIRERRIAISEATRVHGVLSDTKAYWMRPNILSQIDLIFENGSTHKVYECNSILLSALEALPDGTELELWVHPGTAGILQIEAHGELLLKFEEAMDSAWTESLWLAGLGVAMYAGCAYIWYDVFVPKKWKKAVGRIS